VLVTVVSGGKEVDDKNVERVVDVELVEVGKSGDSEVFLLDIDVLVLDGLCLHVDCVSKVSLVSVLFFTNS
jgi:hypothetical protein